MEDLPEEAVIAAAKAIFEHTMLAEWDAQHKARHWLETADEYRAIARIALNAAMPFLRR